MPNERLDLLQTRFREGSNEMHDLLQEFESILGNESDILKPEQRKQLNVIKYKIINLIEPLFAGLKQLHNTDKGRDRVSRITETVESRLTALKKLDKTTDRPFEQILSIIYINGQDEITTVNLIDYALYQLEQLDGLT